jgi:acetylornithine/succinyldiaminopimelate/putrescine aminotransferase
MHNPTINLLLDLRARSGPAITHGLPDESVEALLPRHPDLREAIVQASRLRDEMGRTNEEWFWLEEPELCRWTQSDILNFYPEQGINPYVPLAAKGSWIVTTHGAVIHDSGGYGMLGLGHAPPEVLEALSRPHVMANVMTPSVSQKRLTDRLKAEIGHTRGSCPFSQFVFLNSGSESVTFTCRVTDIHARRMTDPGGPCPGAKAIRLAAIESFHGRTEGPARLSHSTRKAYAAHLASFRGGDQTWFLPFNDVAALRDAFSKARDEGIFIEALFLEPVMGEGIPGLALTREFYDEARRLTREHRSMLVMDSIQAALRAQGCLSIVDYPGFESCDPPDMETYSKALNAGQFPVSVVALTPEAAGIYVQGLYGNTMTTNPRAMEVACAVLDAVTPEVRRNIRERGEEFLAKFNEIAQEFPGAVTQVVGTGLMVSLMLNPQHYQVLGRDGFEAWLRKHGVEMIHGGDTGLRFTPSFTIQSDEIDLIVETIRRGMRELAGQRTAADIPQVSSPFSGAGRAQEEAAA